MSSRLKILRDYAKLDDASLAANRLPPTVYFSHTPHTLTIFDAYPKALFHFLILPRLRTAAAPTATTSTAADDDDDDGNGNGERRRDSSASSSSSLLATSAAVLTSLRTLLQSATIPIRRDAAAEARPAAATRARARARAKGTLRVLADEATRVRGEIEREMRARYGFAWPVWIGFHAVPSME